MVNICHIRSEQMRDFHAISVVNAVAFTYRFGMGEVSLLGALRNSKSYDAELSLVAEIHGQIIGHVLFTPFDALIRGEAVKAAILGPIAVLPEYQRKGIGTMLIEEGHRRLKQKGIDFSLLLGHPEYYPRFGYQPKMWSMSKVHVQVDALPLPRYEVEERRVQSGDVERLSEMWREWFKEASLAIVPGHSIIDWISYGKDIYTSAVVIDGQLCGYLRYEKNNPQHIQCILAKDADSFLNLCSYLKQKLNTTELSLPLPYNSEWLHQSGLPVRFEIKADATQMIKIINEDQSHIARYCQDVVNGAIHPGQLILPVEFDI